MKKWIMLIMGMLIVCAGYWLMLRTDQQTLGWRYYYLPQYEAYDLGYPDGGIIYKSSEQNVFSQIIIHGSVIAMNENSAFIIALQCKNDSTANSTFHSMNYYIIDRKTDAIYGPYKEEEYLVKREELEVPRNLQLQ
jgi:hypothetical protein